MRPRRARSPSLPRRVPALSAFALAFAGALLFTKPAVGQPLPKLVVQWIAFGGAGLIEGTLWKRLGWATRLSFFIPAVQESFNVTNVGIAFKPAQIGVLLGLGGRVSIW